MHSLYSTVNISVGLPDTYKEIFITEEYNTYYTETIHWKCKSWWCHKATDITAPYPEYGGSTFTIFLQHYKQSHSTRQ